MFLYLFNSLADTFNDYIITKMSLLQVHFSDKIYVNDIAVLLNDFWKAIIF